MLGGVKQASLDTMSAVARSKRMSLIRAKDTRPELVVRRAAHGLGYRFRLHAKDLPGRPDLVFRSRQKAIFVHGCFWHQHAECKRCRLPKSPERAAFWRTKLTGNARRDQRNATLLQRAGWSVLVIWECETEDVAAIRRRLKAFLGTN